MCVGFILALGWSNVTHGQCVMTFDDESAFLAMTQSPDMESFEGLTATNTRDSETFVLPGFDVTFTPSGTPAGVFNVPSFGLAPTDGSQYISYQSDAGETITFNFSAPKTAFGINILDWGDFGVGVLTFMNNAGDSFIVDIGSNPNGTNQFFGVINYDMPFDMVIFTQDIPGEGYGIDEIYCEFLSAPPTIMACKNVNVSLNEDCYVHVVPSMVLSGFFPCYDDFIVELEYHGKPLGDTIFDNHIGDVITAKVIDTTSGNSCWAEILVEDKFAPEVICQNDTVNCLEYRMHYDTPRVVERCQLYELIKVDEVVTTIPCDENYIKSITQTFVAKDANGNTSPECSRTILIERFPLDEVKCPIQEKTLYCQDNFRTDQNGHPHPSICGVPSLFSDKLKKGQLYGADNQGNYFRIDYTTGAITPLSNAFLGSDLTCANSGVTEIEFDPVSCQAYAKASNGCDYGWLFDYTTGERLSEDIPTVQKPSGNGDFQGAEVIDGVWYVSSVTTGDLEIFDPLTGDFTTVGSHGFRGSFNGLAYDGTTLFGSTAQGGTSLYSVDIATGAATFIGDMGVNLGSLEVGPDGNLYGGGGQMPYRGNFYQIDKLTGAASLVGATGLNASMTSLMWVPEKLDLYPQPDFFCNLWVDYRDTDLGKVGCTRKIMRVWEVQEWWCTRDTSRMCTQFIYIRDTTGPEIVFPTDSVYAKTNTGYHTCEGDVWIPDPRVTDNCHSIDRVDLKYPGGFIKDWDGEKITLPTGFHEVYATAYDSCYNSTTDTIIVHVEDKIAPIAVCDQNTVISLDNDGIVHAYADIFDDGSFDECVIKEMHVRRMDDPCGSGTDQWGEYVEFCCADVNNEVMVAFRVTDKSGNSGTCMVTVLVNDKIPPRVICPPDITVDCRFDWDPNHLDVFGSIVLADSLREPIVIDSDTLRFSGPAIDGVAYDNCPMIVLDSMDMDELDNCGEGILRRYFWVTDAQGQVSPQCTQRIHFVNPRPFTFEDIDWPDDLDTINVCTDLLFDPDFLAERYAYPTFNPETECSLVGHSYKDHVIDNTGGARGCFKILRKWKVIDWCQFNGKEHKKWEYEQVILVENNRAPFINTPCADTVHCFYTNNCIAPPITLSENALDDCTPRDELYWRYKIDLGNDGSFDLEDEGNSVTRSFPADTHLIKWFVEDLCGNETTCEYTFELRNCKAPLAYCKPGVILELTPMDLDNDGTPDTEMAELWASDLDDGSSHECGYGVTFSFSADTSDKVRWYDCDSIGLRTVSIYVTDRTNGNQSVCITSVTIQDNNNVNVCTQTLNGTISGIVRDRDDRAIVLAEADLPGSGAAKQMTNTIGAYSFADMPFGGAYTVELKKDDDYLNGVTTGDLVRIQRHLLGMVNFNSPWQYIAADVNMSADVSSADIADIRKVILGVKPAFASAKSWRFIDGVYTFSDPNDPLSEPIPHRIDISVFDKDIVNEWVGVKLGDIDNSADPSGLGKNQTRSSMYVHAQDRDVKAGEEVLVAIDATHLDELEACQFTLQTNLQRAEIIEVVPLQEGLTYGNFNLSLKHLGILPFAWTNAEDAPVGKLFALRLRVLTDGRLSETLSMSDDITTALSYVDGNESAMGIQFVDEQNEGEDAVALFQNQPNPWSVSTEISFYLPNDRSVLLTIIDANGKTVWSEEAQYEKGYNQVLIEKSKLNTSGVFYYQIQTDDFFASKKMLIL